MTGYMFDSGILILHLRNQPGYAELTNRLMDEEDVHISVMTRLEVVRGMRDHERAMTFGLLDSMLTIPVSAGVADLAGELIRSWRLRGVTLGEADTIIAASALTNGLTLVTTNPRHFPMPDLTILQADDAGRLAKVVR